jgi:nucleoside-diphosphate-sugar epimerase
MKKIVITGANGFIGSRLTNLLSSRFEVTPLVRKNADISLINDSSKLKQIDYNDEQNCKNLLKGNDVFIHCAAITRGKDWTEFKKNNIQLTERLIETANQCDSIQQTLFLSSQAAAGPAVSAKPKREADICNPISLYGKSKLLAEHIVKKKSQKPYTIIRPSAVYGIGDKDFLHYFKLIKKGFSLSVGSQNKFLNLIYADELVSLIEKCILHENAYREIFFATDGKIYSWGSFIESITNAMEKKVKHFSIPENMVYKTAQFVDVATYFMKKQPLLNSEKVNEMLQNFWLADNAKSVDLLQFHTTSTLEENLQSTLTWYQEKGWL